MNHEHPNTKFTFEFEQNNNSSFLDVKMCRENSNLQPLLLENLPLVVHVLDLIASHIYHANMV